MCGTHAQRPILARNYNKKGQQMSIEAQLLMFYCLPFSVMGLLLWRLNVVVDKFEKFLEGE